MKEQPYLSIVIPAYNESRRIKKTLNYIYGYLKKQKYSFEIIVVNDGSRDNTVKVVESLDIPNLRVEDYGKNQGKGYAVNYGMLKASGKYIIFADADNATPFEEISKLLKNAEEYPVIIGSRYLKESKIKFYQPLSRVIASRIGNFLVQILILPGIKDTQCGFKLFEHSAAKVIFIRQTIWRWGFDMEILYIARKLRYKIKQVPVDWYNQEGSKIQSSKVFLSTFAELFKIRMKAFRGAYKK